MWETTGLLVKIQTEVNFCKQEQNLLTGMKIPTRLVLLLLDYKFVQDLQHQTTTKDGDQLPGKIQFYYIC